MSDKIIYTDSDQIKKLLYSIRDEIEEYVEYLVDVEGIELTEWQQKKIVEPVNFEVTKLELDKYKSPKMNHD